MKLLFRVGSRVEVQFNLQDLWVGLYWKRGVLYWHCYLCIVPALPIYVTIRRAIR